MELGCGSGFGQTQGDSPLGASMQSDQKSVIIRFAKHMVCSDLIGSYGIKDVLEKYKLFRILNHSDLLSIQVHEAIGSCKLLHADLWTA